MALSDVVVAKARVSPAYPAMNICGPLDALLKTACDRHCLSTSSFCRDLLTLLRALPSWSSWSSVFSDVNLPPPTPSQYSTTPGLFLVPLKNIS